MIRQWDGIRPLGKVVLHYKEVAVVVDAQNGENRLHSDDESRARIYRTIMLLTIYCVHKWTTIVAHCRFMLLTSD